jgi:hypothetical protein
LRAEITLNGLQLSVLDSEILHVPERFTVLGVAKILHKSILRASADSLQIKMSNEIDLCLPPSRFESALADVVVAGNALRLKLQGASRMIAETYSTVGRSLPLAWLSIWETVITILLAETYRAGNRDR